MAGPDHDTDDVTLLLTQLREGNQEAANRLVPLIYSELRRMAGAYMRGERPGHTLQATALVNEAYMRLVGGQPVEWQNRAHFLRDRRAHHARGSAGLRAPRPRR